MSAGHHWHDLASVVCLLAAVYFKTRGIGADPFLILAVYWQVRAARAEARALGKGAP